VHFANGVWGLLAAGLFAKGSHMKLAGYNEEHEGWFYSWGKGSGDANLLLAQITEIGWIIGWVTATMLPYFVVLNKFGMFRVDALEEEVGLDITHHRGAAYDLTAAKQEDVDELMERREASHHGGKIHVPDYHGSKVHVPDEVTQSAVVEADGA
jgi:ammonium transporter, Amt family